MQDDVDAVGPGTSVDYVNDVAVRFRREWGAGEGGDRGAKLRGLAVETTISGGERECFRKGLMEVVSTVALLLLRFTYHLLFSLWFNFGCHFEG